MSLLLLALLAAPPPAPPPDVEEVEGEAAPATDPEDVPEGPDAPAAPESGAQPDELDRLPRDERYDPILPYGETPEETQLEYAEETPPEPTDSLEYAEESPPPPEFEYDQTRQRTAPTDKAVARESDQNDNLGKPEFRGRQASPQRFAIELKFGPYLPNVDKRYTGDGLGPYAMVFGETDDNGVAIDKPKQGLFTVLGFEWQFVHLGGPFSLGTTIGFFRDSAQALQIEPDEDGNVRNAADKTSFVVVPVTLLLGYRFELLADRFRVPLVPYARGGLGYGFWRANKGDRGDISYTEDGQKTHGGSWGWQVNLGLMLRLDFIERAASTDLDRLTGINHTYLFGEWQFSRLGGFGSEKRMEVGDDTFTVGFAVEF